MQISIGEKVNQYKIIKRIGEGGFGVVYSVQHVELETFHALKTLHIKDNEEAIKRFRREARAMARMHHPHVAHVTDFGSLPEGGYYLIMDLLQGKSLEDFLGTKPRITLHKIRIWMQQICDALHYVHEQGIVHRDLKPANIFLCQENHSEKESIKLLDFGIASWLEDVSFTRADFIFGSPHYMSPEQAEGKSAQADRRADIYALGIILYQMLTGIPPFRGDTFASFLRQHLFVPPPPLSEASPQKKWARSLDELIQSALQKQPAQRPSTTLAFLSRLLEALDEQEKLTPDDASFQISLPKANQNDQGIQETANFSANLQDKLKEYSAETKLLQETPQPTPNEIAQKETNFLSSASFEKPVASPSIPSTSLPPDHKRTLLIGGIALLMAAFVGLIWFVLSPPRPSPSLVAPDTSKKLPLSPPKKTAPAASSTTDDHTTPPRRLIVKPRSQEIPPSTPVQTTPPPSTHPPKSPARQRPPKSTPHKRKIQPPTNHRKRPPRRRIFDIDEL